jgi:hypothetical protein
MPRSPKATARLIAIVAGGALALTTAVGIIVTSRDDGSTPPAAESAAVASQDAPACRLLFGGLGDSDFHGMVQSVWANTLKNPSIYTSHFVDLVQATAVAQNNDPYVSGIQSEDEAAQLRSYCNSL